MMKKYVLCGVMLGLMACGDNEPAAVPDMGAVPGGMPNPMRDMGSVTPTPDFGKPQGDMSKPLPDMTIIPPIIDMGTGNKDQGMDADQGGQNGDMSMMPVDMGNPADMGSGTPMCGNGVLEAGELCDGDCPTSCDDGNACTTDSMAGSAGTCNVVCINQDSGAACGMSDGCCPAGCTEEMDEDCSVLQMLDCRDPATWPAAWKQLEDAVIAEVNVRRSMGGSCGADMHPPAPALVFAAPLREAGRCHALDMVMRDYFASRSPEGESALDRASAAGYAGAQSVGQDIGTHETVVALVDNWMTRQGNCNHILNARYDEIGVGYMESSTSMYPRYWVQVVADKP